MKIKTSMTDENKLLELLKKGDSHGFKEIYDRTFNLVRHYIVSNSGHTEDAEDLFQDGMIAFLNNIRNPNFALTTSIENYFMSIIRNLWLGQLKKNKIRNVEVLDNISEQWMDIADGDTDTLQLENERQESLYKHFELLGEDCKKLLTWFYYYQRPLNEIATEMNYTYDFIKVKKFRCMKELKSKMM